MTTTPPIITPPTDPDQSTRTRLRRFVIIVSAGLAALFITLLTLYLIVSNWGGTRREALALAPNVTVKPLISFSESNTYPVSLARDRSGVMYLSRFGMGAIDQLTPDGKLIAWLAPKTGVTAPAALAFAPDGALYVIDFNDTNPARATGVIKRITPDKTVTMFGAAQTLQGLSFLSQMVFDMGGNLYVTVTAKGEVWRFPPGGTGTAWLALPRPKDRPTLTAQPTGIAYDPLNHVFYIGDDQVGALYRVAVRQDGTPDTPTIISQQNNATYPAIVLDEIGRVHFAQWTKENGEVNGLVLRIDDEKNRLITPLVKNLRAPSSLLPTGNLLYVVNSDLPGLVPTSGGAKLPFTVDVVTMGAR